MFGADDANLTRDGTDESFCWHFLPLYKNNQTYHFDSAFGHLQIFYAKVVMNSRSTLRSNMASDGQEVKTSLVLNGVAYHMEHFQILCLPKESICKGKAKLGKWLDKLSVTFKWTNLIFTYNFSKVAIAWVLLLVQIETLDMHHLVSGDVGQHLTKLCPKSVSSREKPLVMFSSG